MMPPLEDQVREFAEHTLEIPSETSVDSHQLFGAFCSWRKRVYGSQQALANKIHPQIFLGKLEDMFRVKRINDGDRWIVMGCDYK